MWRLYTAPRMQNTTRTSSASGKAPLTDDRLDKAMEQLGAHFDALGGSVVDIAGSLRQQVLLGGEQAQVLSTIQQVTADTLQRLSAQSQSHTQRNPQAYALVIRECMGDMQTGIDRSLSTAIAARSTHTRRMAEADHALSSLKTLNDEFNRRFEEMKAEFEKQLQEQRSNNADTAQQFASLERTLAGLVATITSMAQSLEAIQRELERLRRDQVLLGDQVRDVLTENAALKRMVQTLVSGTHDIPTLAIVLPEVSTSWESVKHPMRLLRNQFRLYFLCSHTKQIAPCGPQGNGYRIQVTKQWVQDAAPVLRVGLVLVKVALLASGLPLPVPDLCSALADATKHCKYLDIALQLVKCPVDDAVHGAEYVMQTTLDAVKTYDVNSLVADQGAADPTSALQLQEGSRKAYETIREVLVAQGHNIALTCGLRQVTCSRTGRTAWVLDNDATERAWKEGVSTAAPANNRIGVGANSPKVTAGGWRCCVS
jgi:hypothetical protein